MSDTPTYQDHPIPPSLQAYFTRIMELNLNQEETLTVPARPTGHLYIGWLPLGHADAVANGQTYVLRAGQGHILGQLSAFDAQYRLHGPVRHFLGKCTMMGGYQLLNRDLGALQDVFEIFDTDDHAQDDVSQFYKLLETFTDENVQSDPNIEKAGQMIVDKNGDISVAELAEALDLSERHLRRKFTQQIGIAPKTYALIRKVLSTLQILAQNPEAQILDLVHDMGYYDQAHLHKIFQLYMRVSPKKLRLDEDGVLQSIVAGVKKSDFYNTK